LQILKKVVDFEFVAQLWWWIFAIYSTEHGPQCLIVGCMVAVVIVLFFISCRNFPKKSEKTPYNGRLIEKPIFKAGSEPNVYQQHMGSEEWANMANHQNPNLDGDLDDLVVAAEPDDLNENYWQLCYVGLLTFLLAIASAVFVGLLINVGCLAWHVGRLDCHHDRLHHLWSIICCRRR
jgi:hypothetical protein